MRHLGPSMVGLLHRGVESTVRSRGHVARVVVVGVVLVVVGRHERATPDTASISTNTAAATIGSKAAAAATSTTIHLAKLAPLLWLLELSFSIMNGDVHSVSARHSDGVLVFLGQVPNG